MVRILKKLFKFIINILSQQNFNKLKPKKRVIKKTEFTYCNQNAKQLFTSKFYQYYFKKTSIYFDCEKLYID